MFFMFKKEERNIFNGYNHNVLLLESKAMFISPDNKNIYVTLQSLPPLEEFIYNLKDIWESKKLTNKGKYHRLFEDALTEFLGVKYISLFTNGTLV